MPKCGPCGRVHSGPTKTCPICLAGQARRRAVRIELGLCVWAGCLNEAAPGRRTCEAHRRYNAAAATRKRNRRTADGLCQVFACGTPPELGHIYCTLHREQNRREEKARRARKAYFRTYGNPLRIG